MGAPVVLGRPLEGGSTQRLAWQSRETQSLLTAQKRPLKQAGQEAPPQSTSVSLPLSAPSLQLEVVVVEQIPPLQNPLAQSKFEMQAPPLPHSEHEPPQSTSLSLPLRNPSLQVLRS